MAAVVRWSYFFFQVGTRLSEGVRRASFAATCAAVPVWAPASGMVIGSASATPNTDPVASATTLLLRTMFLPRDWGCANAPREIACRDPRKRAPVGLASGGEHSTAWNLRSEVRGRFVTRPLSECSPSG